MFTQEPTNLTAVAVEWATNHGVPIAMVEITDSPLGEGTILELVDDCPGCPACGDPIDYCQGHGEFGDPQGHALLALHDHDIHLLCHPMGCDESGRDW